MGLPTMQFHNVLSFSFNYEKPTKNITVYVCVCISLTENMSHTVSQASV